MKKLFVLLTFFLAFLFVESGNAKEEIWIAQDWVSGEWENVGRDILNFDGDNMIDGTFQTWSGNDWLNDSRISYTYDSQGHLTGYIYQIYEGSSWVVNWKIDYFYEGDNIVRSDMYSDEEGELVKNASVRYTYNSKGLMVTYEFYQYMDGEEILFMKDEYTYDASDREIEYLAYYIDYMSGDLKASEKTTSSYEGNSEDPSIVTDYLWAEDAWIEDMRTLYSYNANGFVVVEIVQAWYDEWINMERTETHWDSNYETQIIHQSWNGEAWEYTSQVINEYHDHSILIRKLDQIWMDANWENSNETTHYYDDSGDEYMTLDRVWSSGEWVNSNKYFREGSTSVLNTSKDVSIDIYPNPTTGNLNVSFSLENSSRVSAHIFSLDAKSNITVINGFYQKGAHKEFVQLNELPNGAYVINLRIGTESFSKKFVVSK